MMVFCHQCHKLNRGHALFCSRCGRSLDSANASHLPLISHTPTAAGPIGRPIASPGTEPPTSRPREAPYGFDIKSRSRAIPPVPPIGRTLTRAEIRELSRPQGKSRRWLVILLMLCAAWYFFRMVPRAGKPGNFSQDCWPHATVSTVDPDRYERHYALPSDLAARLVALLELDGRVDVSHRHNGLVLSGGKTELDSMEAFLDLLTCSPGEYQSRYRRSRSGLMEPPTSRTYIFATRTRAKAFARVLELAEASRLINPFAERNKVQVRAGDYDHHIIGEAARLARAQQVLDY
jgi:hypothetical protein